MATLDGEDLANIKDLVDQSFDEKLDDRLDEKLSHLPSKDEFYKRMDDLMTQVKASRQENAAYSAQVKRLTDKVERHHPSN